MFGLLAASVLYMIPSKGRWIRLIIWCGLPGLASALSGAILGVRIFDPKLVKGGGSAAIHGLLVILLAYLFLAPMFTAGIALTDSPKATVYPFGMSLTVLWLAPLLTGVYAFPLGALAGYLLFRVRGRLLSSSSF